MRQMRVGLLMVLAVIQPGCAASKPSPPATMPTTQSVSIIDPGDAHFDSILDEMTKRPPLSPRTEAVLNASIRCEARRMKSGYVRGEDGKSTMEISYGPSVLVKPEIATELKTSIAKRETFRPVAVAMCFDPGLELAFIGPKGKVVAQICFGCANVEITADDQDGHEREGRPVFTDQGFATFFRLAGSIFPNDPAFKPVTRPAQ